MNFALLGDNPACLPLARAIAAHPDHRLTHVVYADAILADVMAATPGARACTNWDELLADGAVDAAIIAGHTENALEAARRLAQAEVALLVCPDARQGIEFAYELSLIRDDKHVALYPVLPGRFEPPFVSLCELIQDGRLGSVLHLQLERHVATEPVPAPSGADLSPHYAKGPPLLTQSDIDCALLEDVDLLRVVGGHCLTNARDGSHASRSSSGGAREYDQVTAVYTGTTRRGVAMASVTLAGDGLPEVSWSTKATSQMPQWKLMVIGQHGTAVLSRDDAGHRLRSDDVDMSRVEDDEEDREAEDPGSRMLAQFEALLAGENFEPDWADLVCDFELVNAARRSVSRRRTVDVHFESTSERSIFKSQMTTLGCGVLVVTLLAVVLVLTIGAVFEPPKVLMRVLRLLAFAPLFVFLLLQLLLLITRPPTEGTQNRRRRPPGAIGGLY